MISFTVGPAQMDEETRQIGSEHVPYFRTPEFSEIMKENKRLLCKFFDVPKNSRVVFMTGSETASMNDDITKFFTVKDNVLEVNGGSFVECFVELSGIYDTPFAEIKLDCGQQLTKEKLIPYEGKI